MVTNQSGEVAKGDTNALLANVAPNAKRTLTICVELAANSCAAHLFEPSVRCRAQWSGLWHLSCLVAFPHIWLYSRPPGSPRAWGRWGAWRGVAGQSRYWPMPSRQWPTFSARLGRTSRHISRKEIP
jgi:hypothetical protein